MKKSIIYGVIIVVQITISVFAVNYVKKQFKNSLDKISADAYSYGYMDGARAALFLQTEDDLSPETFEAHYQVDSAKYHVEW